MRADVARACVDVPQIGVEFVRQDALGHIVVDGARKLRHELFEPGAARTSLLAHVVVAVVDAFEVADARVVARVAAIVEAVGRAQQLLMLETLLIARDLAVLGVGEQPDVGVAAVVALIRKVDPFVDRIGVLRGLARAHVFGYAVDVVAHKAGDRGLGDAQTGGGDVEVGHRIDVARHGLHLEAVAVDRHHFFTYVEVLAAPEIVEAFMGDDGPAVRRGGAGGHEARAMGALRARRRVVGVLRSNLRPPVAGQFHPCVPADDVAERRGEPTGGESVSHALHLIEVFLLDVRLMELHGLFHKERVVHAERFERHVCIDADGVTELVGE